MSLSIPYSIYEFKVVNLGSKLNWINVWSSIWRKGNFVTIFQNNMFCHHKHSFLNMAWNKHAQFIKNTTSINHAKALVPCTRILEWRHATWILLTSQLLGNCYVSSWKFSFFFLYPLFIVRKKPRGQMTVLNLSFDQIITDILFSFCFFMSQLQFSSPTKFVLQLITILQIAFDISLAT